MSRTGVIGGFVDTLQEETEKGISTAKQQITGKTGQKQSQNDPVATQQAQQQPLQTVGDSAVQPSVEAATNQQAQDDQTQQFVKDMYTSGTNAPELTDTQKQQKEQEEKQKLEQLRNKLHSDYYQQLTNPQSVQQEERPAEKNEREDQEKTLELQKIEEEEKKKELPTIVTKDMGTKEKLRGVSG